MVRREEKWGLLDDKDIHYFIRSAKYFEKSLQLKFVSHGSLSFHLAISDKEQCEQATNGIRPRFVKYENCQ
jgi:hypothetical protein